MPLTPDPSDAELVARALQLDEAAFESLVLRHYPPVYAVCMAVLSNRADAEDVCHDTFLRVLGRLDLCTRPDRFAPWILTIARNLARNKLSHPYARRATSLETDLPAPQASATRELDSRALRDRLERALAQLEPLSREVVLLHDLLDWTHGAIAAFVGTTEGMSRQLLFKARRRLRDVLGTDALREHFDE